MATGLTALVHRLGRMRPAQAMVGRINSWLRPLGPWPIRIDQTVILAGTLDRVAALMLLRFQRGERMALGLWDRLCVPGATVVDVGANLGLYSLRAAGRVGPQGRVIAFEADPDNCRLLSRSALLNHCANLQVRAQAVAERAGTVRLYLRPEHKGDSQLHYSGQDRPSIEIPAVTLDQALDEIWPVQVLKLDIQGAEALAIQGMEQVLAHSPGLKVISEFWPEGLLRCGLEPLDYLRWWFDRGFTLSRIDEQAGRLEPVTDLAGLVDWAWRHQDANLYLEHRP